MSDQSQSSLPASCQTVRDAEAKPSSAPLGAGSGSLHLSCSAVWRIRRLHKGSGKARWHTIATGLSEYLAKTWCRDSNAGSRNWHYKTEVETPNDPDQRPVTDV